MTPKFLYFDLGRVLLDFDVDRMACQMGLVAGVPAEAVKQVVFSGDLHRRYESGEISSEGFYEEFCLATGTRADRSALDEASSDIFEVNSPMLAVVAGLRAARYPMGLLSNTCESHWLYCRRRYRFLADLFDVFSLSYEIRAMKPHRAIFEAAAQKAGREPGEIFFVDDIPGHVEGAREAGFDAVVYQSAAQVAEELRRRGIKFNY
ncbi:MAG TPA: HAD family phosphatase [Thermoguttaceae bacterium]|nr:HAD family phosphatase [Thermoguttaceae bacterium]